MALKLGLPLQQVMRETTSSEFIEWCEYLDLEETHGFHRTDYYLAQVAAEIRRMNSKNPRKVKLLDFLLKFKRKEADKPKPGDADGRMQQSKQFWKALTGIGNKWRSE